MALHDDPMLEAIDPHEAWQPASPEVWNLKWAAHLYRRAGFGSPPVSIDAKESHWTRLQTTVSQGMEKSIEQLFTGAAGAGEFDQLLDSLGEQIAKSGGSRFGSTDPSRLQGWWLYRMLYTPHPLQERMTFFWHDHFATSVAKVGTLEPMFRQNQLLRAHGLGKFEPLVRAMGRDPAMVVWLDSNRNSKGHPNENYARELMELFTLGVGNYAERDIQEAARAFTGWGMGGGQFAFNASLHDDGQKTVLGQSGPFDGDEIVAILLRQPAAPRFLAGKLYREFVSETPPAEAVLEPLARQLADSAYDVAACVRMIFRSQIFYSQHAYRQKVKGPVQYVVNLVRSFDGRAQMSELAAAMRGLGQALFAPPNVKGWDGGTEWLNTATLLARHNLAWKLVNGKEVEKFKIDPAQLAQKHGGKKIDEQIDFLAALLLQEELAADTRNMLLEFGRNTSAGDKPQDDSSNPALREIAHAMLTMPAYQLA
jgi:hypothetical protein